MKHILIIFIKKSFSYLMAAFKDARNKNYQKLFAVALFSLIIAAVVFFYSYSSRGDIYELSNDELRSIETYVQNVKIEDAVGQILMVGIPGDILNYTNNKHLEFIISDLGIGNLFANKYNYFDKGYSDEYRDIYFNKILSFHNHLQALAKIKKNKIPLLIAANFEGPDLSCLEDGVIVPPESLVLASTQNTNSIRLMGRIIGYQLRSLGIHVLMGPVLDIDSTAQGDSISAIRTRSYGGDINRVFVSFSHYIRGLQEGRIQCFGKHFPGHGAVRGNPHDLVMPTFEGGATTLKDHLEPYPQFMKYLNGVMTSHVYIKFMDPIESRPVTFSKEFVSNLLRDEGTRRIGDTEIKCLGFKDQVIITDDLSDMGSINKYMDANKKTFPQVAIEAFESGHDMLLFSHVEVKGQAQRGTFGKFKLDDLKKVKEQLVSHISASPTLREQLKNSLRRILKLKAKINKTYQAQNSTLFASDEIIWQDYLKQDITNPQSILKGYFRNTEDFLHDIFASAYFIIYKSKNAEYDTNRLPAEAKVTFYINERYINLFKKEFSNKFKNATFVPVPIHKGQWFKEQKTIMLKEINKCDHMYYTLSDIDDRNLLDNLLIKAPKEVGKKLVIILHTTPSLLTPQMLPIITTIGNFSKHQLSYQADIDFINGHIEPKDISKLPINLGINSTFHDIAKFKFDLKPAEGFFFIPFFSTDYEHRLWKTIRSLQHYFIFFLLVCLIYTGYKFFVLRKVALKKVNKTSGQLMNEKWSVTQDYHLFTSSPKLFIWFVITLLLFIFIVYFFLQLDDTRIDFVINRISKFWRSE